MAVRLRISFYQAPQRAQAEPGALQHPPFLGCILLQHAAQHQVEPPLAGGQRAFTSCATRDTNMDLAVSSFFISRDVAEYGNRADADPSGLDHGTDVQP